MRDAIHLYRLSDCMGILRNSADPVLLVLCNDQCRTGSDCARRSALAQLNRDGLLIVVVHHNELPDILNVYKGLAWGHAVLLQNVRMVEHWEHLPTPERLAEALSRLSCSEAGTTEQAGSVPGEDTEHEVRERGGQ